jgi:hypothetical protein
MICAVCLENTDELHSLEADFVTERKIITMCSRCYESCLAMELRERLRRYDDKRKGSNPITL